MSELSSDDVVAIVGPIGDAAVAEIIGTGISKDELVPLRVRDETLLEQPYALDQRKSV